MKKILVVLVILLISVIQPAVANGNGKIITNKSGDKWITKPYIPPMIAVNLNTGSLRDNIERIAREHGWSRVVWNNKKDYNWVGQTKITYTSFEGIMGKILKDYPLQAVFYQGNHILVIQPRTI